MLPRSHHTKIKQRTKYNMPHCCVATAAAPPATSPCNAASVRNQQSKAPQQHTTANATAHWLSRAPAIPNAALHIRWSRQCARATGEGCSDELIEALQSGGQKHLLEWSKALEKLLLKLRGWPTDACLHGGLGRYCSEGLAKVAEPVSSAVLQRTVAAF